jgi:hypothetical protein
LEDKLCFVQFLHPGSEHTAETGKVWNALPRQHRRKFLINPGKYVDGGKILDAELCFWGEWEPQSQCDKEIRQVSAGKPRYFHRPYYTLPDSPNWIPGPDLTRLHNTDPFVFDEPFLYTNCKQIRKVRTGGTLQLKPTQLQYLKRGSVILFGSHLQGNFVLDTVFVVGHCIRYQTDKFRDSLNGKIANTYEEVTVKLSEKVTCENTLYFGATYSNPVHGMFSFFPCQPYESEPLGFARPAIKLPDVVTDALKMNYKANQMKNVGQVKCRWQKVVKQMESQGLHLGIYTVMPKQRA